MEGGDQVVMLLARSCRTAAIFCEMHCSSVSCVTVTVRPPSDSPFSTTISSVDSAAAGVAVGKARRSLPAYRPPCPLFCPPKPRWVRQRPARAAPPDPPCLNACSTNTLQRDKSAAVDLKGGILGRGPDQDDAALFHKGQERILLCLVEAVDLVHKYDGPAPRYRRLSSACCMTSLISLMPLVTALKSR